MKDMENGSFETDIGCKEVQEMGMIYVEKEKYSERKRKV